LKITRWRCVSCLLLLFWIASNVAFAQDNSKTGSFEGVVVDAMGVPIPRTIVWIHEETGKASFSARADQDGHFAIQLPEGYYHVLFSSPGFAAFCKAIWVRPGKQIELKVKLKPDLENSQY